MAERKRYRVRLNGNDTVLNLSDADAKKLYPDAVLIEDDATGADQVRAEPVDVPVTRRAAPNKARTTENK